MSIGPVERILSRHRADRIRLLDILRDVQAELGCVPDEAAARIADRLGLSKIDVEGVVSFYHFLGSRLAGRSTIYLNTNIVSVFHGRAAVAAALEEAAGCRFGEVSPDGRLGLRETSCIGMNDQEPSALVDGIVFTRLTPAKARSLAAALRAGRPARSLVRPLGDGANRSPRIRSMVVNNVRVPGPVLLAPFRSGAALKRAVAMSPEEVIVEIRKASLLGRGGAGFRAGLKWDLCRREATARRFVVANADEGEPGTFKDRVLLTERPALLFEGMAVAGYAIGAREGILYLRGEYAYLRPHLEAVLAGLRRDRILGPSAGGKRGFAFDVAIKQGAGAYICGEESALLNSAEGRRGEPRNRPPFPVQFGYLGRPSTVNNVETLCAAARIMAKGAAWFKGFGTPSSPGTKLFSVSGDCARPGVYELEFGTTVWQLLKMAGGAEAQAVQVGGPSGTCVSRGQFNRVLGFEDLATGGSIIVIGPQRDLFEVIHNFLDFFIEESCGWCTPCRAGNVLLKRKLLKVTSGKGTMSDLADLESWGKTIKATARCGLGQTSPNPILTSLQNFRELYIALVRKDADFVPELDLRAALGPAAEAAGRVPAVPEEAAHE